MSIVTDTSNMGLLTRLPYELRENIFEGVDPHDLASLSLTCKAIKQLITGNRKLYRALYLEILDEPPARPNCVEYDWIEEIHKYVKTHKILESKMSVDEKTQYLSFITDIVSRWMKIATPSHKGPSLNIEVLTKLFENRDNQEAFFCNSTIFARARRDLKGSVPDPGRSYEERQMSAKLHTIYGVPIDLPRRARFNGAYPYACSVVYDLRNYNQDNMWGPYKDGLATADWERLEAIMVVLGHNLRMFTENTHGIFKPLWSVPWQGASPDSYAPNVTFGKLLDQPAPPVNALDPYNISGTWMRVVCFLDFSELFAYNFNAPMPADSEPRGPIDTTEAIRLIIMEISVDSISEPGENDGKDLPIVHFQGTSRSMHSQWDPNANSNIKGTVRLTKEGEVRWTSISVYQGEERWKSEGIQIGGVKSSRGVLGHWFDKDYDHHGPAGPTAFWKVSNEIDDNPGGEEDHGDADDEGETEYEEVEVEIQEVETEEDAGEGPVRDMNDPNVQAMLAELGVSALEAR